MAYPEAGKKAPSFPKLSEHVGSWILLYFYPKDDTPGCTKEACAIRDAFPDFKGLGITVLGVSIDSEKSHAKFITKYDLPFTLVSDETKEIVGKYGVWAKKKFMGREYMGTLRTSFLIDPAGNIRKIYENVKPESHVIEVLEDVRGIDLESSQNGERAR